MRHHEHALPRSKARGHESRPPRREAHAHVGQRLGADLGRVGTVKPVCHVGRVARISRLKVRRGRVNLRRAHVEAPAVRVEELVSEALAHGRANLALKGPIVTLVEPPGSLRREPRAADDVKHDVGRLDGAAKHRRHAHDGGDVSRAEQLAGMSGLVSPVVGERHVDPSGKAVDPLVRPGALPVAHDDERCHVCPLSRLPESLIPPGGRQAGAQEAR